MTRGVTLTVAQSAVVDRIAQWWTTESTPVFYFTGFAGTGKTTVARYVEEALAVQVAYAAPTGKAASVLRRRGCYNAQTLHRWLYRPVQKSSARLLELLELLKATGLTPRQQATLQAEVKAETTRVHAPAFSRLEESPLKLFDVVFVDEASMVTEEMLADLLRTGVRILAMGDPAQLPPVKARSPFLHRTPDAHLSQVHRHALESGLLRAATLIREGDVPAALALQTPDWRVSHRSDTTWEDYAAVDQVLVARNDMRRAMNQRFRVRLGHKGLLDVSDRVVFLRNDYEYEVYNGTTGTVVDDRPSAIDTSSFLCNLQTDEGPRHGLELELYTDGRPVQRRYGAALPADYAYALTVHKAQGSEWDRVLVYDDAMRGNEYLRWLYTAVTRGRTSVHYVRR